MSVSRQFRPVRPEAVEQVAAIAARAREPIFAGYREAVGDSLFEKM